MPRSGQVYEESMRPQEQIDQEKEGVVVDTLVNEQISPQWTLARMVPPTFCSVRLDSQPMPSRLAAPVKALISQKSEGSGLSGNA